ncbi:hypothetical protein AB0E06_38250 [Streptomyces sp. NPDC048109]|uniref:hypothetical protein n=1 Tax=Streptomyces sp. NPDC048109 TaxID=3155482 RepID=UPI003426B1A8
MYDDEPVAQVVGPDAEPRSSATTGRRRWISPRSALFVRRGTGLAIALGMAYVGPVREFIGWVVEDPGRAWIALAALVIPRIGLYYLLFEDRK